MAQNHSGYYRGTDISTPLTTQVGGDVTTSTDAQQIFSALEAIDGMLTRRAVEALGTRYAAAAWMIEPNGLFGGRSPLWMATHGERVVVLDVLSYIEYGILS